MPTPLRSLRRCGALLALLAPAALAQPVAQALDFDAALALAEQRAPLLRASEAAAQAARERAVAAAERPDPVLRIGIANLPVDGPERFSLTRDFMTVRSVGLMQEFTRADKLRARAARFDADAALALAQRDERLTMLRHQTALAWLERHDLERLQALLREQRDEARLAVDAADAAYRGARGTQADAFGARAELAALEDRLAEADNRIAQARIALARWVGAEAAQQPLGARPDVARLPLDPQALPLAQLPALLALDRQIAKAESDVDIARSERRTDWSAELMYGERGSRYSDMVSITLSRPLAIDVGQRQQREVAARLNQVEQLRAERDELLREQRERIATWQREWTSARERGTLHERELIPLANERTRAALTAYRAGSGTLAAVLDARRAEIAARIERLQLDTDAARAWAQLAHLFAHPIADPHGATR
jgi:outer membrane protein TolC